MKKRALLVAVVAGLLVLGAAGLWLASRPTAHVAAPTAAQSPEDVVRTYVRALDSRDFETVHLIEPRSRDVDGMSRWILRHPSITDLVVLGTRPVDRVTDGETRADGWAQAVWVEARATLHAVDGSTQTYRDVPWSFLLVRQDDWTPWQIEDQGQG